MAYTLQTSGLALNLKMLLGIDQDGSIREFVSADVNSNMTVHANVTTGTSSWKGTTRGYFQTSGDGGFTPYGITFPSPHRPIINLANPSSVFMAAAEASAGTGAGNPLAFMQVDTGGFVGRTTANKLASALGNGAVGTTTLPTVTKFSVGYVHNSGGTERFFYGLESGSLATDGTATDDGRGGNYNISFFGGDPGGQTTPGKWHIVGVFNKELSTAEFQSLHDDWFGTLFQSSTTCLDEDGEWIITTQSW